MNTPKTHCRKGHPYNPLHVNKKGHHICRDCIRVAAQERYDSQYKGGHGHRVLRTGVNRVEKQA